MDTPQETLRELEPSNGQSPILDWTQFKFDAPTIQFDAAMLSDQTFHIYSNGKEVITIESGLNNILGERGVHLVITKDNIEQILESLGEKKVTVRGRPYPLE